MGRLFGTDGARGVANSELTCELAMQIGRAAAMVLIDENKKRELPKVKRRLINPLVNGKRFLTK